MADQQALYKEFKYLNSSSLNIEIQIGICRLELPMDIIVDSKEAPGELYLTSHILSNQMTMHEVSMRTYYATPDKRTNSYVWDYMLNFPLKYRDLSRNSMIVFTVWKPDNTPFGGTSMYLFNECGAMKRGKQKLVFYFDRQADTRLQPETYGELYDKYSFYDEKFQNEKKLELYRNGYTLLDQHSPAATCDWLDRLMLTQLQATPNTPSVASPEAYDLLTMATLVIEMPFFPHPVVFDEKCYPSVPPHMPITAMEMLSASGIITETVDAKNNSIMEFNLTGKPFSGQALGLIVDWEMELDNPCEEMYHRLAQDSIRGRGTTDLTLKPNLQEKEKLDRILKTPGDHIRSEDKDLMYRFRYALTENKMALAKFLLSVDWSSDSEQAELPTLLGMWKAKAPIDVADALKLLGRGVAFQSPIVRQYAVDVLRKASDDELRVLLLQLVQALRYEPGLHELVTQPLEKNENSDETNAQRILRLSPLAAFLIERGCQSNMVANFLYWFVKVEVEDATMGSMFESVFDAFMETLANSSQRGGLVALQLMALDTYVMNIGRCQRMSRDEKGKKDAKEACMKRLLSDKEVNGIPNGLKCIPLPLDPSLVITGLDPMSTFLFRSAMYPAVINFRVQPVDSAEELLHDHVVIEQPPVEEQSIILVDPTETSPSPPAPDHKQYKVIFKSGDDLRQDQLIMQFISLMDSLLKKVNLDLRLLTYGILATGPVDGIMEFVRDSMPVSAVTSQHGSILAFLRHYNGDPNGPLGVKASAMDTYVRSCAGSCVVTYLLGIGDRHLDNVMMVKNGQMFHIDFGFIFGRDPKPLPPPFRFTRAMAEAMGGEDHEQYNRFKSYCCQAFNWLRKSANLILNLLSLMADAGIPDLSVHSDPVTVLGRVEEKFRLDLSDEQAEQFFLGLINETLTALAPRLMELAHQIAVARR